MSAVVRWVLASANRHKVEELRALLADLPIELVPLTRGVVLPPETGTTFLANARLKARSTAEATQGVALADDSGIEVDALGGEPGVRSARYAGEDASDEDNNRLLLENLKGIHGPNRRARFRCVLALVAPGGREVTSEGRVEGFIADAPRGARGFGYDPLFQPEGEARTFGEFETLEKHAISHRARAARKLADALARLGRYEP